MTKPQYIHLRSTNQINIGLAYQMYISVLPNEPKIAPHLFNQVFPIYVNMLNGDMTNYWKWCDIKFEVNVLVKKDGNVIYC
jgi:hypothetical protein